MPIYYRGSFLPQLQWEENDFDPQRGFIYRAMFKGMNSYNVEQLSNQYTAQGIACRLRYSNEDGMTTLEVVDSTEEFTLDTWNLDGDEERVDLFSLPTMLSLFNGTDNFSTLRGDVENNTPTSQVVAAVQAAGFSSPQANFVGRIYSLYLAGTTEFRNDAYGTGYVLKHSTNVSNRWTVNVADSNVGEIYSPAELLTEVSSATLWINPLPPRLQYKLSIIASIAQSLFPALPNYAWGWLKSRSNESTAANNRVNIQTNYTFALWSTDIYPYFA